MTNMNDKALIHHLLRRAGFGGSHEEIESYAEIGYDQTVDKLLDPESTPNFDYYKYIRRHTSGEAMSGAFPPQLKVFYSMLNSTRPLEEKMTVFWMHIFATALSKVEDPLAMADHVETIRKHALGNFRTILQNVARDPAMIFWLDNNENHKIAPNENWGRELLELFSLGVGNYTEEDVLECSRAFTGWTFKTKMPVLPFGRHHWGFQFLPEDHDYEQKTFLGQTGTFDGDDIIDIILQQPACPKFIARHMYSFFVEDEAQVPAWGIDPPKNPEAIDYISELLVTHDYEIKPVMKGILNSEFFKKSTYRKMRSPFEMIIGTLKLVEDMVGGPDPRLQAMSFRFGWMGQDLLYPPSVEGWHTGKEWITSGALVERINFASEKLSDVNLPGVRKIIDKISNVSNDMSPESVVENCLEYIGYLTVQDTTKEELIEHASQKGNFKWEPNSYDDSAARTGELLGMIGTTREYQFG